MKSRISYVGIMFIYGATTIKVGVPPTHIWFLKLFPHISWLCLIFLRTVQKLLPLYMGSAFYTAPALLAFSAAGAIALGIRIKNQTTIKRLMAYSGLFNRG